MDAGVTADAVFDIGTWGAGHLGAVERALDLWVSASLPNSQAHAAPAELIAAMRYAVLDGGKRLRPLLVLFQVTA